MMDPLISVVTTTHNLEWCVGEAISSVLAQTYPRTEVIVVDDASTDNTRREVASFGSRVQWIQNARRTGDAAANRNIGIHAASGEYIAFLDGDDVWEPEKLAVQVAAARQYPRAGLIAVDGVQFRHEDGAILKSSLYDTIPWSSDAEVQQLNLYERLLRGCCIDTPSQVLVHRRVLDEVGAYTPRLPRKPNGGRSEDYAFLIRVAARCEFVLVRRRLVRYRYHPSSLTGHYDTHMLDFAIGGICVLHRHLASADEHHTPLVRKIIRRQFLSSCEALVQASRVRRRAWASRYLFQLVRVSPTPAHALRVGISLARVWRPNIASRALARLRARFDKRKDAV